MCYFHRSTVAVLATAAFLLVNLTNQSAGQGFQTQISDDHVIAIAEQPDGAVLAGGYFEQIANTSRAYLVRFLPDGTLDTTFNPAPNDNVRCLAVQDDGKILVGGRFTSIGGQPRIGIARLNPDGSLDPSLLANTDMAVESIAIQNDGKIIISGGFRKVGGVTRQKIARIMPGGTLDPDFNPDVSMHIETMSLDAQGRILIGGDFISISNVVRRGMARLLANGQVDTDFVPDFNGRVSGILSLPDGSILAGIFSGSAVGLRRFSSSGTVDPTFNEPRNILSETMCLQTDGKILAGGRVKVSETDNTLARSGFLRLQPNGMLDAAYAGPQSSGVVATAILSNGSVEYPTIWKEVNTSSV